MAAAVAVSIFLLGKIGGSFLGATFLLVVPVLNTPASASAS